MSTEFWYVWDGAKDRFVQAKRPPRDPGLVEAMRRLEIRLARVGDREKLLEFRRVALESEPIYGFQTSLTWMRFAEISMGGSRLGTRMTI